MGSVKSEILHPKNCNKEKCNLSLEEIEAIKILIKLQRERKIIIKPCDKGAGLIILNFNDYLKTCYEHLFSSQIKEGEDDKPYYEIVSPLKIEVVKTEIEAVLQEAVIDNIITKDEAKIISAKDKNPGKFYVLFKVHKKTHNRASTSTKTHNKWIWIHHRKHWNICGS